MASFGRVTNTAWIVWTDGRRRVNFTIGGLHTRFDRTADAVKIGSALIDRARNGVGNPWIDVAGTRMTFRNPDDAAKFGAALVKGSGQQ